jgi:hypothetical protein
MADYDSTPRRHGRRDFLTIGAAAAAVVAGITVPSSAVADPFALGGRQDDSDAEIAALFQEWQRAEIATEYGRDDDEIYAACDVATAIAEQIFDAPIAGLRGFAIKAFMFAHFSDHGDAPGGKDDVCKMARLDDSEYACRFNHQTNDWNDTPQLYMGPHAMLGMLASAVQFAPELEPLVAEVLSSPRFLADNEEGEGEDA